MVDVRVVRDVRAILMILQLHTSFVRMANHLRETRSPVDQV